MTTPILVTGGTGHPGAAGRPAAAGRRVRHPSAQPARLGGRGRHPLPDRRSGDRRRARARGGRRRDHHPLREHPQGRRGQDPTAGPPGRVTAGVRHLVYISVGGADRIPVASGLDRAMFGYFASKLAAEKVIADSGLPWTALRATQFPALTLLTIRQLARLPVVPVPAGWRVQPVDAGEVAARLVELALGPPAGLASCRTWAGRGCMSCPRWCAGTCGPVASTGRSCRCGCQARPPERTGLARTWPRTGRWAAGPGRSSSRSGRSQPLSDCGNGGCGAGRHGGPEGSWAWIPT